jgi:hypothetical protein
VKPHRMKSSIRSVRVLGSISLLAALGACDARGSGNTGPIDSDGGAADTGAPADATLPPVDVPTAPVDAETPPVDVGTPPVDVGNTPCRRGNTPCRRGNTPCRRWERPLSTLGTPPVDVGTPPVDAGGLARYRRTVTDATLVEACTLPGAQRVLVNADDESTTLIAPFDLRFFGITVPQNLGLQVYSNGFISQMAIDPTMAIGRDDPRLAPAQRGDRSLLGRPGHRGRRGVLRGRGQRPHPPLDHPVEERAFLLRQRYRARRRHRLLRGDLQRGRRLDGLHLRDHHRAARPPPPAPPSASSTPTAASPSWCAPAVASTARPAPRTAPRSPPGRASAWSRLIGGSSRPPPAW